MKDIDKMFEDILKNKNKEEMFNDNSWVLLIIILALLENNDFEKEQPTINIYLGDE